MQEVKHVFHVIPWLRRVGNALLIKGWLAITIGNHTISWRELYADERDHEYMHVLQWDDLGWRFVPEYVKASLEARRHGLNWYWDNAFEIEARDYADFH